MIWRFDAGDSSRNRLRRRIDLNAGAIETRRRGLAVGEVILRDRSAAKILSQSSRIALRLLGILAVMQYPIALHRIAVAFWFVLGPASAWAAITWTGDIDPSSPPTWTSSTSGFIGKTTEGTITVDEGSGLLSKLAQVGDSSGSVGVATVTGTGSFWNNSTELNVGNAGNGKLNISAGGTVTNTIGRVGSAAGSVGEVTVNGVGSQWNSTSFLIVAWFGNGTLNVHDGGMVTTYSANIASSAGSNGEVTVSGTGSQWNAGGITVGGSGRATLNIQEGGVVGTLGTNHLGLGSGSNGEATISGIDSKWIIGLDLIVGRSGVGTLSILRGGTVTMRPPI